MKDNDMEYLIGALIGIAIFLTYHVAIRKELTEQDERRELLFSDFLKHQLKTRLSDALDKEDYAEAARLRDLINKK